jgi:WD40 repeat protein
LQTLSGHTSWVESVAWSPDGKRLATGGYDATVQVYTMDIHDLMNLARQRITAHPSEEACRSTFTQKNAHPSQNFTDGRLSEAFAPKVPRSHVHGYLPFLPPNHVRH